MVVLSGMDFKCTKTQYSIETGFLEKNKVHKLLKQFSNEYAYIHIKSD